jgi:hypothetical protein
MTWPISPSFSPMVSHGSSADGEQRILVTRDGRACAFFGFPLIGLWD